MSNLIQIKRGKGITPKLENGEIAINFGTKVFSVGDELENIDFYNSKIIDENLIKKTDKLDNFKELTMSRLYRSIDPSNVSKGSYVQGMTYTKDNKVVYALYDVTTPTSNIVKLVEININTGEVLRIKELLLGHCNSLSFNLDRNVLLSATLYKYIADTKTYVKEIIEIDYDTLNIVRTVNIDTINIVSGVAFNSKNKKTYLYLDYDTIAVCNPLNYTIEKTISLQVPVKIKTFVRQSLEIWDNKIYLCGTKHNYLSVYNMKGENIENYYVSDFIDNMYGTGELEDISSIGNGRFLMSTAQNIGSKYVMNAISEFSTLEKIANGLPYGFFNPNGPVSVTVDINSTTKNPDGSNEKPFKQLNEALLFACSPMISNLEINLKQGIYDWCYSGALGTKVVIFGEGSTTTKIKGMFLNGSDIVLNAVGFDVSENEGYNGLINSYNSRLVVDNVSLATTSNGIVARSYSDVTVRTLLETGTGSDITTIRATVGTKVLIQRTATNVISCFADNSSQILPSLLFYNNPNSGYLQDIPIPKWAYDNIVANSFKYLDVSCGLKVTPSNPTHTIQRILTSSYNTLTIALSRVSGKVTYISTVNYNFVTVNGNYYWRPRSAYITTMDFNQATPTITTKDMEQTDIGAIYISRIFLTN